MKGKKAGVLYARTSPKPERKAADSHSIETQLSMGRAWCDREGVEVIASFSDEGWSGGNPDRPGLADAIVAVPPKGLLVVVSMDRIARDIVIEETTIGMLKSKGAAIVTVAGDVAGGDDESPERELLRQMMACVSKFQRRAMAARTSAQMRQLQSNGHCVGSQGPYGYRVDVVGQIVKHGHLVPDKRLVEDADEQNTIAAVMCLREAGLGVRAIARHLNESGARNRKGNEFDHKSIQRIIKRADSVGGTSSVL